MEYEAHREELDGGVILKVIADDDRDSPRDWGNDITVMVCDHGRYNLGDDDGHDKAADAIRNSRDYRPAWEDDDGEGLDFSQGPDLYNAIRRCSDIVTLPLYLYDHSGITISTGPFSCPWDSGQVGFIFMDKPRILANCYTAAGKPGTILTKALRDKAVAIMESDTEVYDQYLTGDVWGYVVEDEDGDTLDSLWGMYGLDYAIDEGRKVAEAESARIVAERNADEAAEMEEARPDLYPA